MAFQQSTRNRWPVLGGLILGVGLLLSDSPSPAQNKQSKSPAKKQAAEVILPMDAISTQTWLRASTAPLRPGEIDGMVHAALNKAGLTAAPLTGDEEFVRRVYLDLTGQLPVPADVTDFLAAADPGKRAKLIDRLLDSDDFARHWARYWREVVTATVTERQALILAGSFETWMQEQLKANTPWNDIVRALITAQGELRFSKPGENGSAFFLLSRRGADATTERAAEISRLFLGVQIQCAQCHDHPFDNWKRIQFHELAAYLARTRERPIFEEKRIVGIRLVSVPFGEHRMADPDNPRKQTTVYPKFLDGQKPKGFLSDQKRREALADAVTSKENPWFAAAHVNRLWGELMGQSFYKPIDDLGPQREAVLPEVITRLAGAFRGSEYDIKQLFRTIMNTDTYQRKIRLGAAADQHLLFAASYPTRLHANALWQSLEGVLGQLDAGNRFGRFGGGFGRFFGLKNQFLDEFNYDPSARPEDVEGTVPQALLMMNNPTLNQKIEARGTNLLARILKAYSEDRLALDMVYLRTLARRPTDAERQRCFSHIAGIGNRAEAFEDILWVLLNSTEFQTRR